MLLFAFVYVCHVMDNTRVTGCDTHWSVASFGSLASLLTVLGSRCSSPLLAAAASTSAAVLIGGEPLGTVS